MIGHPDALDDDKHAIPTTIHWHQWIHVFFKDVSVCWPGRYSASDFCLFFCQIGQ
jgi:hypothetical protein